LLAASALYAGVASGADEKSLAQQIFDTMQQAGAKPGYRTANKDGVKQAGRYKILPVAGQHNLSDAEAKTKSANFLAEDLRTRLKTGPVKFRLVVQLANPGDPTNDGSLVRPDDRRTIDVGTLSITSVVADSEAAQKTLVFSPTNLTDGIELSDHPLPSLRTSVYALSFAYRQQPQ
jgi:catalase